MKVRGTDARVGAVALALCAAAFAMTFYFTTNAAGAMLGGMGAEFFPRLILALIAILAVCILLGFGNPAMDKPEPIRGIVWVTAAILAAYTVALEILGMWPTSFLLLVGLGWLWGERSLAKLSFAAVGLLAVIWLVFVRLLKGNFPDGLVARFWS